MRFLSDEWIAAVDAAAGLWVAPPGLDLTVQQVVNSAPGGDGPAAYHLTFAAGRLRVGAGRASTPDVTITQSYAVAAALSRGDANAQQALAEGNLRVTGDVGLLARHARTLAALDDVFSSVRAVTTY